jgi:hypothetical protein
MPTFCGLCEDQKNPTQVRGSGRICSACSIRTGKQNPRRKGKTEEQKDRDNERKRQYRAAQTDAIIRENERKRQKRAAKRKANRPDTERDPLPAELESAYNEGKAAFDAEFDKILQVYPERMVTISAVAHSSSSEKSFNQECVEGSLVGGKKKGKHRRFKIVRRVFKGDTECWRGLLAGERRQLSFHQGSEIYISDNKKLAEHVEKQLHTYLKSLEKRDSKYTLLQTEEGKGGCMGTGQFRVGVRFIVHKEDGSFQLPGAIFRDAIGDMPNYHDVEEPAAKPRAVKRKVSE